MGLWSHFSQLDIGGSPNQRKSLVAVQAVRPRQDKQNRPQSFDAAGVWVLPDVIPTTLR
jgi:hypothetical protein